MISVTWRLNRLAVVTPPHPLRIRLLPHHPLWSAIITSNRHKIIKTNPNLVIWAKVQVPMQAVVGPTTITCLSAKMARRFSILTTTISSQTHKSPSIYVEVISWWCQVVAWLEVSGTQPPPWRRDVPIVWQQRRAAVTQTRARPRKILPILHRNHEAFRCPVTVSAVIWHHTARRRVLTTWINPVTWDAVHIMSAWVESDNGSRVCDYTSMCGSSHISRTSRCSILPKSIWRI